MLNRLDFWITILTLAAGLYFLGWKDFLEPRLRPIVRSLAGLSSRLTWLRRTAPFNPIGIDISRYDAAERENEPVRSVQEPPHSWALNGEDVAMVARMIAHNRAALKPTKTETVYAGCGKKRGESPAYVRCAELYDLFFKPTAEALYPVLAHQRQQVRAGKRG